MKTKIGAILTVMLATGAMAQMTTNTPPPLPGASQPMTAPPVPADTSIPTNKPAAKPKAKPAPKPVAKKKTPAPAVTPVSFGTNDTAVVNSTQPLNVRGQARINSEIITRLKHGDAVTVLKQVTLKKPQTDEPANWAQIILPAGTHVWVSAAFVDAGGNVTSKKLNIRTGAGENYSVIGELKKGDSVKVVGSKGEWKEIESTTNAYGFVAAHMLARKEPAPPIFIPPTVTTTIADNNPTVVPAATAPKVETTTPPPVIQNPTPVISVPTPTFVPAPEPTGPPPPRIVQREGTVGETVSIQAPTYFHLESLDTGRVIDYIHSSTTNLMLGLYVGKNVLISGEEELDERWPNTPVLLIKRIQLVK